MALHKASTIKTPLRVTFVVKSAIQGDREGETFPFEATADVDLLRETVEFHDVNMDGTFISVGGFETLLGDDLLGLNAELVKKARELL